MLAFSLYMQARDCEKMEHSLPWAIYNFLPKRHSLLVTHIRKFSNYSGNVRARARVRNMCKSLKCEKRDKDIYVFFVRREIKARKRIKNEKDIFVPSHTNDGRQRMKGREQRDESRGKRTSHSAEFRNVSAGYTAMHIYIPRALEPGK